MLTTRRKMNYIQQMPDREFQRLMNIVYEVWSDVPDQRKRLLIGLAEMRKEKPPQKRVTMVRD